MTARARSSNPAHRAASTTERSAITHGGVHVQCTCSRRRLAERWTTEKIGGFRRCTDGGTITWTSDSGNPRSPSTASADNPARGIGRPQPALSDAIQRR